MKTLHLYLLRQVLLTLFMTVMVFTFVLLLANVLKEILSFLVNRQVSLLVAGEAILLLIPFVLVFALPMGMLTAALLVFGRFSADSELVAARASGVSLISLVSPVLLLSCALSIVCAVINLYAAPQCRVAYKKLIFEVGLEQAGNFLPEQTYKDFRDHIVYVDKVNGTNLSDILIYNLEKDTVESYIKAAAGRLHVDRTNQTIGVQLIDAWYIQMSEGKRTLLPSYYTEIDLVYTNKPARSSGEKVKLTDMSFTQLNRQLQELEGRLRAPPPKRGLTKAQMQTRLSELERQKADLTLPIKMQIHRQASFSFACIAFTLVGIPLGIRAHRRETTFGIFMALVLVCIYYSFFVFGQAMDRHADWAPYLVLWLPNFIFQAVGAVLLWRANRGI